MTLTCLDGRPVRDAKRPLEVYVTPNDIKKARKKAPDRCAVAVACRRQEHVDARVFVTRAYIHNGNGIWNRYMLPMPLQKEIVSFDRGGDFEPGPYKLRPPKNTERLGKRRSPKRKAHRNKNKRVYAKTVGIRLSPRIITK